MARTTLSPVALPGGTSAGVGFQEFTWSPGDVGNGNQFASTGKEMLFARNVNADSPLVDRKLTVHKTAGKIEYTLGGGDYVCVGQVPVTGWKQTDTFVYVNVDHANVELAVLVLP